MYTDSLPKIERNKVRYLLHPPTSPKTVNEML